MNKFLATIYNSKYANLYICLFLFFFAFFFRSFAINSHLFFGFEQGRDAIAAMNISQLQDFVLVGPKTDIAGIFHGAWYYYLMALPYGLSNGNPIAASLFLITLNSFVPFIVFISLRELKVSKNFSLFGAMLAVISWELISYSRWLSNVSPAVFFMALNFYSLIKYSHTKNIKYYFFSVTMAAVASQFEIITTLWYSFLYILLFVTKLINFPKLKAFSISALIALFWYLPLLLFNLRNQFIMFLSVKQYFNEEHGHTHDFTFFESLKLYINQFVRLFDQTFSFSSKTLAVTMVIILTITLTLLLRKLKERKDFYLILACNFMTLPVIFFTNSMGLIQLYVGLSIPLILLLILTMYEFSKYKKYKFFVYAFAALLVLNTGVVLNRLNNNTHAFFRTIQDDLNLKDQKATLEWIEEDSQDEQYRLALFTIPYFQGEGWQYLHSYYYPKYSDENSKYIYVIIEEKVEDMWRKKWTEELGNTELLDSKKFGLISVEKRLIL